MPKPRQGRGRAPAPVSLRPEQPLARADFLVAGAIGLGASAVFASTFSSRVALGDAPETVAGVRSLGILHAPGYPVYVLAARAFGEVVRIGSWELRVNLFSVVCSALAVAGVALLSRVLGASRTGAAIGAFALATTVSFWFNAGLAKHYAFAALVVVAIALGAVLWLQQGRMWLLLVAAALAGASIGVAWQLSAIVVVGLACMAVLHRPRPRLAPVLVAAAVAVVSAVAVCVYVVVRARQDPTVNYGNATDLSRLVALFTTADFKGTREVAGSGFGNLSGGVFAYFAIVARDIGLGAVAVAAVGVVDVVERRRRDHGAFFAVAGLGNVVAIGLVSGIDGIAGFATGLIMGGQLVVTFVVLALLAALGATRLQLGAARRQAVRGAPSRPAVAFAAAALAVLVVVPSVVVHYANANHRIPPLADRYAKRVLAALPPDSVFLAGGWEYGQPVVKRKLLDGDRPDVTVVSADSLAFEWYREQLVERLGLDRALIAQNDENPVTRVVAALREQRPVFADQHVPFIEPKLFGYEAAGIVTRIVDGSGPQAGTGFRDAAAALRRSEEEDGIAGVRYSRFPNWSVYAVYKRAHVELAKQFALADDLNGAADELERALTYGPEPNGERVIQAVRANAPGVKDAILQL